MKIWTYKAARDQLIAELDLQEEDFIGENEMVGYFNKAIDTAEATIHNLHEDYFLTRATLSMVNGDADVDPPSNIYAQKIRGLIFRNGSVVYPVRRMRGSQKFFDTVLAEDFGTGEPYRYLIRNDSAEGSVIQLVPASRDTGAFLSLWYLRNANRVPLVGEAKEGGGTYVLADVEAAKIDIPEFVNFVMETVRGFCLAKENGGTIPAEQAAVIEQQRQEMVNTLSEMVEDDDNEVVQDLSHYMEHE